MSAAYDVPDRHLHDAKQDGPQTPAECLADGDTEAWDAFNDYCRSEFMKQEMLDFLTQEQDSPVVQAWIKDWSAKVERGEV